MRAGQVPSKSPRKNETDQGGNMFIPKLLAQMRSDFGNTEAALMLCSHVGPGFAKGSTSGGLRGRQQRRSKKGDKRKKLLQGVLNWQF